MNKDTVVCFVRRHAFIIYGRSLRGSSRFSTTGTSFQGFSVTGQGENSTLVTLGASAIEKVSEGITAYSWCDK